MTSETMILENLNGSSAIRTEYTGHKTKGTNCHGVHVSDILVHVLTQQTMIWMFFSASTDPLLCVYVL